MCRSLDHLVGESEHFVGNSDAERLGGFEIDDEIEFGRLLDRQLAGLRPAQNLSTNSAARRNRSGKLAPYVANRKGQHTMAALLAAGAWLFGATGVLILVWR